MAYYVAQYYESEESRESPYAATPNEKLWASISPTTDINEAINTCIGWRGASYKTSRVIETDDEGKPVSVVWMSAWEAPVKEEKATQGASTTLGFSCKLQVWEDNELGPVDHWPLRRRLSKIFKDVGTNGWELVYGRAVDTRGRQTLYSIRLNIWPVGKKHPSQWAWWKIFEKDEDHADDVEFVRAVDIDPKSFPPGAELANCFFCGRTHEVSKGWKGWCNETDDMEAYCSCVCIDDHSGADTYRINPDGEELEEPGCEYEREQAGVV